VFRKVIAAVDGSENGWKALDTACSLCAGTDAQLIVAHVVVRHAIPEELASFGRMEHLEPFDHLYYDSIIEGLENSARERARENGVSDITWIARFDDPVETILSVADEYDADLIVMGRRGFGSLDRLLMGSVAHKVSNLADCTCAIVAN
jgi:nucleotide-binding universal stress UspA family protein